MHKCTKRILSMAAGVALALSALCGAAYSSPYILPDNAIGLSVGVSSLEEFRDALEDPEVLFITLGHSIEIETEQEDWSNIRGPKVILGMSRASLALPKLFEISTDTAFDQLTLLGAGGGTNIFANGNTLVLGDSVSTPSQEGRFIGAVYGGFYERDYTGDTNLVIKGGRIPAIYGGGHNSRITGNTSITLGESGAGGYIDGGGSGRYSDVSGDKSLIFADYGREDRFADLSSVKTFTTLGISGEAYIRLGTSGNLEDIGEIRLSGGTLWLDGDVDIPYTALGYSGILGYSGGLRLTGGSHIRLKSVDGTEIPVTIVGEPDSTYLTASGILAEQFLPPAKFTANQEGPDRVSFDPERIRIPVELLAKFGTDGFITPVQIRFTNGQIWDIEHILNVEQDDTGYKRWFLKYTIQVEGQRDYLYAQIQDKRLVWFIERIL